MAGINMQLTIRIVDSRRSDFWNISRYNCGVSPSSILTQRLAGLLDGMFTQTQMATRCSLLVYCLLIFELSWTNDAVTIDIDKTV